MNCNDTYNNFNRLNKNFNKSFAAQVARLPDPSPGCSAKGQRPILFEFEVIEKET